MYDERGNDGNGKTLIQEAWKHGSKLTTAVGNKVGDWLKKQPVQQAIQEEEDSDDTHSSDIERKDWVATVAKRHKEYRENANNTYQHGKVNKKSKGGRSKKRGKRTHRKTKRRRH